MKAVLQPLIALCKQLVAPAPLGYMMPIALIEAQCQQFSENLIMQLSRDEKHKYGGYYNNNKGLRRGLLVAKDYIKRTDPNWVTITETLKIDEDKRQFLQAIHQQLNANIQLSPSLLSRLVVVYNALLLNNKITSKRRPQASLLRAIKR